MLGFSRMDIIRRLILLIAALLIGARCLFPAEYYIHGETRISIETAERVGIESTVDIVRTVFQCIGIAVIGGMLFYILGDKKKSKD